MKLKWLKAVGLAIGKGAKILGQAAGLLDANADLLKALLPARGDQIVDRVVNEMAGIQRIVIDVEALGVLYGWTGPQKLDEAAHRVASLVINTLTAARRPVENPALLADASRRLAQAVVDILNSFEVEVEGDVEPAPV